MESCKSRDQGSRHTTKHERTRITQDLLKTGEGRSRIEMDDEIGQTKRARVEASVNDEPMSVERSEGQGHQSVSTLSLTLLSLSFLSLL